MGAPRTAGTSCCAVKQRQIPHLFIRAPRGTPAVFYTPLTSGHDTRARLIVYYRNMVYRCQTSRHCPGSRLAARKRHRRHRATGEMKAPITKTGRHQRSGAVPMSNDGGPEQMNFDWGQPVASLRHRNPV